ncbi:retrotransposon protein [Cucumis melo var. makuwa]|uniref:Retrotransposon protein n=1 Tax=Cucumis melo var. makuwa TaxID=1194695 RepID=A0A5D3E560_CUCMM|nr:retrotransposon protein [Cucumis melo var. makuwa]
MINVGSASRALDETYIKVNMSATDRPSLECDLPQTRRFYEIALHDKMACKCQRDIIICAMRVIQTLRDFSPLTEANCTTCKRGGGHSCRVLSGVGLHEGMKIRQWYVPTRLSGSTVASCSEGLLKKLFPYCDKLTYVFDGDRAIGRFDETSIDMRFNKLIEYDGFEMPNGNEEFPSVYSQGIDMSHEGVRALQPSHV